eukprot:812829-Pelagomonas_calceolata.AAC.1
MSAQHLPALKLEVERLHPYHITTARPHWRLLFTSSECRAPLWAHDHYPFLKLPWGCQKGFSTPQQLGAALGAQWIAQDRPEPVTRP